MTPHRQALSALALFVGGALLASAHAQAEVRVFWKFNSPDVTGSALMRGQEGKVVVTTGEASVASVTASVRSDAGDEDLVLTEPDAWLHGAAALSALPVKDAALTLTLYDEGSASLMTFSGTLATDGTVTLAEGESTGTCEVVSKLGCTVPVELDVEVLAAEVYPTGKGYLLTLDLAGADTYNVAYATVEVSGGDKAEVAWDAIGSVWEAESALVHSGVIDVKAKTLDARGDTVENVKAELAEAWLDDGGGVNALSAGSGTSVAVSRWGGAYDDGKEPGTWSGSREMLTVVSDGWTTRSYPTHAELELAGGGTVTLPANSYQRVSIGGGDLSSKDTARFLTDPGSSLSITGGGFELYGASPADLSSPICSEGTCVVLVEGEKGPELAFTAYGETPSHVVDPTPLFSIWAEVAGKKVASDTIGVTYEDAVTAVFAGELAIDGDPIGGDASGIVSLLGAADRKGRQDALTKGTFYGSFTRDSDGDLGLGGYGADEWATSDTSASVLIGDPVECGGAGCDGDWGPPVLAFGLGGKVTKIVVSSGGLDYNVF